MNPPERLRTLLRELAQQMGLGALPFDAEGGCALELDQRMIISLQYQAGDDALWLYADLGELPRRSPALLEKLLQANLFWHQTSGATLSLSGDEPPHAVLARAVHWQPMGQPCLAAAVELFVNSAEHWQDRLRQTETETEVSTQAAIDRPMAQAMELLLRSHA